MAEGIWVSLNGSGMVNSEKWSNLNRISLISMKNLLLIWFFMMVHTCSYQQGSSDGNSPTIYNGVGSLSNISGQNINIVAALDNTNGLKVATNKRVEGSVFFCNEWHWGYIRFPNGAVVDSVKMRFNALTSELYFLDGEKEYYLNDFYSEFGYADTDKEGSPKVIIRTGFPIVGKNNIKTNYQLLTGGYYILLKSVTKELQENRSLDGQTYYRIAEEANYFVFNSINKTITPVRKGMQQLESDFPDLKQQITNYCNNNKQKCKTEPGLIELFSGIKINETGINKEAKKPF